MYLGKLVNAEVNDNDIEDLVLNYHMELNNEELERPDKVQQQDEAVEFCLQRGKGTKEAISLVKLRNCFPLV